MIAYEWVVWLILLFPLAAFVIVGLVGRRLPEGGGTIAVGAMAGSFVLSMYVFIQVLQQGGLGGGFIPQTIPGYVCIPSLLPETSIKISLLIDNLSSLMLVLVSFLCLLIFVYSLGYMHEDDGKARYYAEVSLFATGMLGTVSPDNFLQLLIFWEIMGLCSYLLIGFWYSKPEAATAAKKAFLVTRVGDVLFLVGVLVIWNVFGTFSFGDVQGKVASLYPNPLTPQLLALIPLLLFGGAVGKSAQFPLHAWLPDAMEGPTTVSALIHAATMVKAGVYLTARAFIFLVPLSSAIQPPFTAILVIAAIGGFTTLFAATMAGVNFDIKRVLAFSTISQLAYLFLGLGVGTAFLTAFYAFRLWFMTFHGEYRGHDHPHESPRVMTAPLIILAGFTLASGLLAYPMGGFGNLIFSGAPAAGLPLVGIPVQDYLLEGVSMGVAVLGLALAWAVYATKRIPAERFTASRGGAFIHRMLTKRYSIDDAYDAFGRPGVYDAARALDWFDRKVIDGIVNGVGRGGVVVASGSDRCDRRVIDGAVNAISLETVRTGLRLRQRQTGQVQSYAWVVVLGIVVVIALVFGLSFFQRWLGRLGPSPLPTSSAC